MTPHSPRSFASACAALAIAMMAAGTPGRAQQTQPAPQAAPAVQPAPVPADLPPGAADAIKLTKAGVSEDVILTQIANSAMACTLTTDQIIYLATAGVSSNVIKALMTPRPAAATQAPVQETPEPAPSPSAPPAEVSLPYFQEQLAPYGQWIQTSNGPAWVPAVEGTTPGWRPYCDEGSWQYTDQGLYWQSNYAWGDIPFHYGRWYVEPSYGWVWTPGFDWAPAWVAWRHSEAGGFCGWAPLPPAAVFEPGRGLFWLGSPALGVDVEFGLGMDAYVFIGADHFWDRDYRRFRYRDRPGFYYGHSMIHNGYRWEGGRFHVEGLGRERLAGFTHRPIREERIHDIRVRDERRDLQTRQTEHRELDHRTTAQRDAARPGQAHPTRTAVQARPQANAPARSDKDKKN